MYTSQPLVLLQKVEYGSAFIWLSRIRIYIGQYGSGFWRQEFGKNKHFFHTDSDHQLLSKMLFVAALVYFEKDGTTGSDYLQFEST
jgi:hypothetical protein